MKIQIIGSRSIEHIQKEFNKVFPFLKLEFFTRAHTKGKPTSQKFIARSSKLLRDFGITEKNEPIEFSGETSVFELEKTFSEKYALNVQVFRKSGRIWLETTATDDWTLNSQNEQGRELSEDTFDDHDEKPDYHEQD